MTVADPFQIQQVMLNLINNAHQAMTERGGPGILTLRTFVTTRCRPQIMEPQRRRWWCCRLAIMAWAFRRAI